MNLRVPNLLFSALFCTGLIACTTSSLDPDSQGWVLLRYYTDEGKGISGVEPVELGDEIALVQEVFPGTLEEMESAVLASTNLEELPLAMDTYHGGELVWDVYRFDTQIADVGPFTVSVMLGLATGESESYFVGLVTLPEIYTSERGKILSIFYHTLYAFSPLN